MYSVWTKGLSQTQVWSKNIVAMNLIFVDLINVQTLATYSQTECSPSLIATTIIHSL